jgi:hypothetical protein
LAFALPMLITGARLRAQHGVLEVAWRHAPHLTRWRFVAITFGHVVLGRSHNELSRLRAHEHAHVRQYERWGVLFLLLYPASSLWQLLRGRRAYLDNVFEVDARASERLSGAAQAARRLAALGGAAPDMKDVPRRRG